MEINGYPNYLIYPSGKVYSKASKRYLKKWLGNRGYYCYTIEKRNILVHRLIAEHFIENPDNKPFVDHIDRNRTNNKLNNLRWATRSENNQNTAVQKNNKIGIKNILYDKNVKHWRYKKMFNGKYHQKTFKTLEEAIQYKINYEKIM